MKKLEEEFKSLKENLEKEEKLRKEVEDNNAKLTRGKEKKKHLIVLYHLHHSVNIEKRTKIDNCLLLIILYLPFVTLFFHTVALSINIHLSIHFQ